MGLCRKLSTLRHGRGFGVHSPLGYELISAVLKDKPSYYADAQIGNIFPSRRKCRIGRIILRLIARFQPKTVFTSREFNDVIPLSDKRIKMVNIPDEADMTIESDNSTTLITIGKETEKSGPLILDNEKDLRIVIHRSGLSPTLINTTL